MRSKPEAFYRLRLACFASKRSKKCEASKPKAIKSRRRWATHLCLACFASVACLAAKQATNLRSKASKKRSKHATQAIKQSKAFLLRLPALLFIASSPPAFYRLLCLPPCFCFFATLACEASKPKAIKQARQACNCLPSVAIALLACFCFIASGLRSKKQSKAFCYARISACFVFLLRCMPSVARQQAEGGKTKAWLAKL
jgi:hypothetical protein